MICKNADSKVGDIATLENLLQRASTDKKPLIERELRMLRAGIKGEQESAYLIDFHLKESQKTAVIHDLRIQLDDGRVAQIDHLLIHRTLRFYILETKHFSHGVKITDEGEFLRWNDWKKTYEGMASPIEQNERHAAVLRTLLSKLGMGEPRIESMILIAPQARIERSKRFDSERVVKADQFLTALQKNLESASLFGVLTGLAKTTFSEPIGDIAKKLVRLHRPITMDYAAKFGMADAMPVPPRTRLDETHFGNSAPGPAPLTPISTATSQPSTVLPRHQCRKCESTEISIQYGKFGYYFKCSNCDGNTPIKLGCGKPQHRERLRKDGQRFFRECADCQSSTMFFANPQQAHAAA